MNDVKIYCAIDDFSHIWHALRGLKYVQLKLDPDLAISVSKSVNRTTRTKPWNFQSTNIFVQQKNEFAILAILYRPQSVMTVFML